MEVAWSQMFLAAVAGLVALSLLRLGFYILRFWHRVWRFRHIPHVRQLFHWGSLWVNLSPRWLFQYDMNVSLHWRRIFKEKNSPVVAFISHDRIQVIVNDAEMAKQLFVDSKLFPKPPALYDVIRVFGENIVSISETGPQWKKQRSLCSPAFSIANLKLVSNVVVSSCHKLFQEWETKATHKGPRWEVQVDMLHEINKTALAIISEAGFGSEIVFEPEEGTRHTLSFWRFLTECQFVSHQNCVNNVVDLLWLRLGLPNVVKFVPFGKPKVAKESFAEFENYINEFIVDRKKKQNAEAGESVGRADLLSLLLRAEDPHSNIRLTDEEIRANIFIFLHWPSQTGNFYMKVYDEVQRLLQEKVASGEQQLQLTYEDYKKLNYTMCVFKETLRMYPPVSMVPKMAAEDVMIGGYLIPKNTTVSVALNVLHRNEKYWQEPDIFKPERFLKMSEDSGTSVNPYAFAPFSGGRRSCLGMKFAEVEAVLLLASIVRSFSIHVPPGVKPATLFEMKIGLTATPKHGTQLLLRRRAS
ncbi:Cytochrome P450, family 27, subfamily B, polypeptide 1 [Balamuthia mandrillaris]